MSSLAENITAILKEVSPGPVGLHEPLFNGKEWDYVKQCLDTGWVSTSGSFVEKFENQLAEFTNIPHVIATNSGTSALHVCLELIDLKRGEEVLSPALSFVATANAIKYCDGIPHFVDSEERTLGVDPQKLRSYLRKETKLLYDRCWNKRTNRPIRALIVVHTFGCPVDLDPIVEICKENKLVLIEDAAESLGSYYKGRHTGNWGLLSALSFNGNKIVTTGGGGAILTRDPELARIAKHLTTTAKLSHPWEYNHDNIGYNYRLPNINAALGCAQLEQLENFLQQKRALALRYNNLFEKLKGFRFFTEPESCKSNYWLNVLILDRENANQMTSILELTNKSGIMTRPVWELMSSLPMYKDCPRMDLSGAEDLQRRTINIPSSPILGAKNE
ncbi:MAG: LegC family aminotransferase [Nitrospinota bacterium]